MKKDKSKASTCTALLFLTLALTRDSVANANVVGCEKLREKPQAVPDRTYWTQVRDAYVQAVRSERSTISWPLSSAATSSSHHDNNDHDKFSGMAVPIEVKITSEKGRGVYAAEQDIPKGTSVYLTSRYNAIFTEDDQAAFEKFLSILSWEQACDMLQWCYGYEYDEEDDIGVACGLDEGSLFNHEKEEFANVGYPTDHDDDVDHMIALRDIHAGEELVQDYETFDEGLAWFDELGAAAWGGSLGAAEKREEEQEL